MAEQVGPEPGYSTLHLLTSPKVDPLSNDPASKPSFRDAIYGSIETSSSVHDSGIEVSPTELPQRSFTGSNSRYYIFPPNINGHGRMIPAHRTVPYVVGCALVIGVFAWGVCSAIFAYPLLGGHANNWKSGQGNV